MPYFEYLKRFDFDEKKFKEEDTFSISSALGDVKEYIQQIRNFLIDDVTPPYEKFRNFKNINRYLFEKFNILASPNYDFLKVLEAENPELLQSFLKEINKKSLNEITPQEVENNPKVKDLKVSYLLINIGDPNISKILYSFLLDYYLDNRLDTNRGEILAQNFDSIKNLLDYASQKLPEIERQIKISSPEGIKIDFKNVYFSDIDDLTWEAEKFYDALLSSLSKEKRKDFKELIDFYEQKANELFFNFQKFVTSSGRIDINKVLQEYETFINFTNKKLFSRLGDDFFPKIKTFLGKWLKKLGIPTNTQEAYQKLYLEVRNLQLSPSKEELLKYLVEKNISLLSDKKIKEFNKIFPIFEKSPKLLYVVNKLVLNALPDMEFFDVFNEMVYQAEETRAYLNTIERNEIYTALWYSLPETARAGYQVIRFFNDIIEPMTSLFQNKKYIDTQTIFQIHSQKTLYETVKKVIEGKEIDALDVLLLEANKKHQQVAQAAPFLYREERSLATMSKWILEFIPISALKVGLMSLGAPGAIAAALTTVASAELRPFMVKNLRDRAYEIALEPIQIDTKESGLILKGALRNLEVSKLIGKLDELTEIGSEFTGELFLDTFFKFLFSGAAKIIPSPIIKIFTETPILRKLFIFNSLNSWASEIGEELIAMPLEKLWRGEKISAKDFVDTAWEAAKTFGIFYAYTNLPASIAFGKVLTTEQINNTFNFMKETSKIGFDFVKEVNGELYLFNNAKQIDNNTYEVTFVNTNDESKTITEIINKEEASKFFESFETFTNLEKIGEISGKETLGIIRTLLNYNDWNKIFNKFGKQIDTQQEIDEIDLVALEIPDNFEEIAEFKDIARVFKQEGLSKIKLLVFQKSGTGKLVEFVSFPLDNNKVIRLSPTVLKNLRKYAKILDFRKQIIGALDVIDIANLTQNGKELHIFYTNAKGEYLKITVPKEDFPKINKSINKKGIEILQIGRRRIPIDNIHSVLLRGVENKIGYLDPKFILILRNGRWVATDKVETPYSIYAFNFEKAIPVLETDDLKIYILNIPVYPTQKEASTILALLKELDKINKRINQIKESLNTVPEAEKEALNQELKNLEEQQEAKNYALEKIIKKYKGKLRDDFKIHYAILKNYEKPIISDIDFPSFLVMIRDYIREKYNMSIEEFEKAFNTKLLIQFKEGGIIILRRKDGTIKVATDMDEFSEKDLQESDEVVSTDIGWDTYNKLVNLGYLKDIKVFKNLNETLGSAVLERIADLGLKYDDYMELLTKGYDIKDIKKYLFNLKLSKEEAQDNLSKMLELSREEFLMGKKSLEAEEKGKPPKEIIPRDILEKITELGYEDGEVLQYFIDNFGIAVFKRIIDLNLKYEDYTKLLTKEYNIKDIKKYLFDPKLSIEEAKNNLSMMLRLKKKEFLKAKSKEAEEKFLEEAKEAEKLEEKKEEEIRVEEEEKPKEEKKPEEIKAEEMKETKPEEAEEEIEEVEKEKKPITISPDILKKLKELGYTDLMIEGIIEGETEEGIKRIIDLKLTPRDSATLLVNKYTNEDIEKYLFKVPLEEARKNLEKMLSMKKNKFIETLKAEERLKAQKLEEYYRDKLNELGYPEKTIEHILFYYTKKEIEKLIELQITYSNLKALNRKGYNLDDFDKYIVKVPLEEAKNNLAKMLSMKKEKFISTLEIIEKPEVEEAKKAEEEIIIENEDDRIEVIDEHRELLVSLNWEINLLKSEIKNPEIIKDIIQNKRNYYGIVKIIASEYGIRPEDLDKMSTEEIYHKINKFYKPKEVVFYPHAELTEILLKKEYSSLFSNHLSIFLNPTIYFWRRNFIENLGPSEFIENLDDIGFSVLFARLQQEGIIKFEKFDKEVTPAIIERYIKDINNKKELKDFLKQSKEFKDYFTNYKSLLTEFFDKIEQEIAELPDQAYFDKISRYLVNLFKKNLAIAKIEVEFFDKEIKRTKKAYLFVPLLKIFWDDEFKELIEKKLGKKITLFEIKPISPFEHKGRSGILKIKKIFVDFREIKKQIKVGEEIKEIEEKEIVMKEARADLYKEPFNTIITTLRNHFNAGYVVNKDNIEDFLEFFKSREVGEEYVFELKDPISFITDLLQYNRSIEYHKNLRDIISLYIKPSFENLLDYLVKINYFGYTEHEEVSEFFAEFEEFLNDFWAEEEINVENLKEYAKNLYAVISKINNTFKNNTFYYFIEFDKYEKRLSEFDFISFIYNYVPLYFVYHTTMPAYLNFGNLQYPYNVHFRLSTSKDYMDFFMRLKNLLKKLGIFDKEFILSFGKLVKGEEYFDSISVLSFTTNIIREKLLKLRNDIINKKIKGDISNLKFLENLTNEEINDIAVKEAQVFLRILKSEFKKEEPLPKKPTTIFKISRQNINKALQLLQMLYKDKDLTNKALYFYFEKEGKGFSWYIEKIADDKIIFHFPIFWDTEFQYKDALEKLKQYNISEDLPVKQVIDEINDILNKQYQELTGRLEAIPEIAIDNRLKELKFKLEQILEDKLISEETPVSYILGKEVSFEKFVEFLAKENIEHLEITLPNMWIKKTKEGFMIYPYDVLKPLFDPYGHSAYDIGIILDIPSLLEYVLSGKKDEYVESLINFVNKYNQWLKKQPNIQEDIYHIFALPPVTEKEFWNIFEGNTRFYIATKDGKITVPDFTYFYDTEIENWETIHYWKNNILTPILVFEDAEGNLLVENLKIQKIEEGGRIIYECEQKFGLREFLNIVTDLTEKLPNYIYDFKGQLGGNIKKLIRLILVYNPESGTISIFRSGEKKLYYNDITFLVQNYLTGEFYSHPGIPDIKEIKGIEYSDYIKTLLNPIFALEDNFHKITLSNKGEKKYGKIRFIYDLKMGETLPLKELNKYDVTYFNDPNLYLIKNEEEKRNFADFLKINQKRIVNENFDVINENLSSALIKLPIFLLKETDKGYEILLQEVSLKKILEDFSVVENKIELDEKDISLISNSLANYKGGINNLYYSDAYIELFVNILQFYKIFEEGFLKASEVNKIPISKELEIEKSQDFLSFLENFVNENTKQWERQGKTLPAFILEKITIARSLYNKLKKIWGLSKEEREAKLKEKEAELLGELKEAEKIRGKRARRKIGKILSEFKKLGEYGLEGKTIEDIDENLKSLLNDFKRFLRRKKLQQAFKDKIYERLRELINKFETLPEIDDLKEFYKKYYIIPKEQIDVLKTLNDTQKAYIYYLHPFILALKDLDLSKIEDKVVKSVLEGVISLVGDNRALVLSLLTNGRFHYDLYQAFMYFYNKINQDLYEDKKVTFLPNVLTAYLPYYFSPIPRNVDDLWYDLYFYYLFNEQPSIYISGGKFTFQEPSITIEGDIFDFIKRKYELFNQKIFKNLKEFIDFRLDASREILAVFVIKDNVIKEMRLLGIGNEETVIPREDYKEIYEDLKKKYPKEEGYMLLEIHNHPANTLPSIHNFKYYFRIRDELGFDAEYYKCAVLTEDYIFFINTTREEFSEKEDYYEKNFQGRKISQIKETQIPFLEIHPLKDFASKYITQFLNSDETGEGKPLDEIRQKFNNNESPDVIVFPDGYVSLSGYELTKLENAEVLRNFFINIMRRHSYHPYMNFIVLIKDKFQQEWVSTAFEDALKVIEKELKTDVVGELAIYFFNENKKQITKFGYAKIYPSSIFPFLLSRSDLEELEKLPFLKEEISEKEKSAGNKIKLFLFDVNNALKTGKNIKAVIASWIERGIIKEINTYIQFVAKKQNIGAKLFDMPDDFMEYMLDLIRQSPTGEITITKLVNGRLEKAVEEIIEDERDLERSDFATNIRGEIEVETEEGKKIKILKSDILTLQRVFFLSKSEAEDVLIRHKGDIAKAFFELSMINRYPTKEDLMRNPNILLNSDYFIIYDIYADENNEIIRFETENDAKNKANILNAELPQNKKWRVGRALYKYFLYREKIIRRENIENVKVERGNLIVKTTDGDLILPLDKFIYEENKAIFEYYKILINIKGEALEKVLKYLPTYYPAQETDTYEEAQKAKEELLKRGFSEKDLEIEEYPLQEGGSKFIIWARRRHFEFVIQKGTGGLYFETVPKIKTSPYFPAMLRLLQIYRQASPNLKPIVERLILLAMLLDFNVNKHISEVNDRVKEIKLFKDMEEIRDNKLFQKFIGNLFKKFSHEIKHNKEISNNSLINGMNEVLNTFSSAEQEQLLNMLTKLYCVWWLVASWEKIRTVKEFEALQNTTEGKNEIMENGLMSIENLPQIINPYTKKEISIYDYIDKDTLIDFYNQMREFYDNQRKEIVKAFMIACGFQELKGGYFWREGSLYHLDDMVKTWGKDFYFPHTFFGRYLLKINDKYVASYNNDAELAYILATEPIKHYLGEKRNTVTIEQNSIYSGNANSSLLLKLLPGISFLNQVIRTRNYSMTLSHLYETLFNNLGIEIKEISREELSQYINEGWQFLVENKDTNTFMVARDIYEKTDVNITKGLSNLMMRKTDDVDILLPLYLKEIFANNAFQTKRYIQRTIFRSAFMSAIRGIKDTSLLVELLKIENDLFGAIRDPIAERLNAVLESVIAFFQRIFQKTPLVKAPVVRELAETILSWGALLASASALLFNFGYHIVNLLQVPVLGTIHYGPIFTMRAFLKTLKNFRSLGKNIIGNLWNIPLSSTIATAGQAEIERTNDILYKVITPIKRYLSTGISVAELLNQRWGFMIGIEIFNEFLNSKIKMIVDGKIKDITLKEYFFFIWTQKWGYSEEEAKKYLEILAIFTGIFANYQINFSRVMRGFYPKIFQMPSLRSTILWLKGYPYAFMVNFISRLQNPSLSLWGILKDLGQSLLKQKPDEILLKEAVKFLDKFPDLNKDLLKLLDLGNVVNEKGIEIPNGMTLEEILKHPEVKKVNIVFSDKFFSIARKIKWERLKFLFSFIIIYFLLLGLRGVEWLLSLFYRLIPELDRKVSIAKQRIRNSLGETWYYLFNYGLLSPILGFDWTPKFLPAISVANPGRALVGSFEVYFNIPREWTRLQREFPFRSKLTNFFLATLRQTSLFWVFTQSIPSWSAFKEDIIFTQDLNPLGKFSDVMKYTPKNSLARFLAKYLTPQLLYLLGVPIGHREMTQMYRFLRSVEDQFREPTSFIRTKVIPNYMMAFFRYYRGDLKEEEFIKIRKKTIDNLKAFLKSIEKGYEMLGFEGEDKRVGAVLYFIYSLYGYAYLASSNLINPNINTRQLERFNRWFISELSRSPAVLRDKIYGDALKEYLAIRISRDFNLVPSTRDQLLIIIPLIAEVLREEPALKLILEAERKKYEPQKIEFGKLYELFKKSKK